ncbi:MAG: helix-turn-helix domain-containing protein [Phycisphaerales bacterium]
MPARLPDDERQRIIDLLATGKSAYSIGKEVGHSQSTVCLIAKSIGHSFAKTNLAHAHEARAAYGAEWRADFASRLSAECDSFLESLHGEYLVYNFGGKENDYNEHTLDEPPTEAKERIVKSIRLAMQTVLDIARHDSDGGMGLPAVDEWLATVRGTKA